MDACQDSGAKPVLKMSMKRRVRGVRGERQAPDDARLVALGSHPETCGARRGTPRHDGHPRRLGDVVRVRVDDLFPLSTGDRGVVAAGQRVLVGLGPLGEVGEGVHPGAAALLDGERVAVGAHELQVRQVRAGQRILQQLEEGVLVVRRQLSGHRLGAADQAPVRLHSPPRLVAVVDQGKDRRSV
ncbi:hypothetical protein [Streptomyces sp. NBC_01530]|uniref:hypothetical protein n=1 Tax=Streptomyces sp. NBC_01530 TaxID=2903895 RepID=UPI0038636148